MNLFKQRDLIKAVSDKYHRLDAGEVVEFTQEEAEFAGAFVEDAIRFQDVDNYDEAVKHYEE